MYFKRFFQTGSGGSDPRDKTVAVYRCDACENEEWYIIPYASTFRKEPRKCPKCKSMGIEDYRRGLEQRREELNTQQARIKIEIDQIITELDKLATQQPKG